MLCAVPVDRGARRPRGRGPEGTPAVDVCVASDTKPHDFNTGYLW